MKTGKGKPRIAFFDFACCEGCQLTVLQLEETLLELLDHVEVVAWREAMSGGSDDYDIAFCEGSIASAEDMDVSAIFGQRRRRWCPWEPVRASDVTTPSGTHGVTEEVLELVYGDQSEHFEALRAQPVASVVSVDYRILGCPASLPEIKTVFKRILTGQPHPLPNDPVCVECKRNDTLCVLEKGIMCLGPVTRCGCNAICTAYGDACQGCRGLVDQPNLMAAVRVLTGDQRHAIMEAVARRLHPDRDQIRSWFSLYNGPDLLVQQEQPDHG